MEPRKQRKRTASEVEEVGENRENRAMHTRKLAYQSMRTRTTSGLGTI